MPELGEVQFWKVHLSAWVHRRALREWSLHDLLMQRRLLRQRDLHLPPGVLGRPLPKRAMFGHHVREWGLVQRRQVRLLQRVFRGPLPERGLLHGGCLPEQRLLQARYLHLPARILRQPL